MEREQSGRSISPRRLPWYSLALAAVREFIIPRTPHPTWRQSPDSRTRLLFTPPTVSSPSTTPVLPVRRAALVFRPISPTTTAASVSAPPHLPYTSPHRRPPAISTLSPWTLPA